MNIVKNAAFRSIFAGSGVQFFNFLTFQKGPYPMHEVVVMAVRKAVSAATNTLIPISTILFFNITF